MTNNQLHMSHFKFTQSAAVLVCAFVLVACNHFNPDNGPVRLNQVGLTWGEVQPKTDFSWATYKYCNETEDTMTKYCTNS